MSLVGKLQGMISTVPHGTGIPSRYKRNCDNSIYIFCIRVKHIINILSWDTIEPRYFFRAQGQSFHSYTIGIALSCSFCNHRIRISVKNIKCFLQVRVDQHEQRHRQRRVRIWTVTDICMNTYLDSDRQNNLSPYSGRRLLLCAKYRLNCRCYIYAGLRSASGVWCRTVGDIRLRSFKVQDICFFPKLNVCNDYKSNIFRNKKNSISRAFYFLWEKFYLSWMTVVSDDIYRTNWIILPGTNFKAWHWHSPIKTVSMS